MSQQYFAGAQVAVVMDITTAQMLVAVAGRLNGAGTTALYEALKPLVGNPYNKGMDDAMTNGKMNTRLVDRNHGYTNVVAAFAESDAGAALIKRQAEEARVAEIMAELATIGEPAARMWQEVTEKHVMGRLNRMAKVWATDVGCFCKPATAATYKPAHGGYPG